MPLHLYGYTRSVFSLGVPQSFKTLTFTQSVLDGKHCFGTSTTLFCHVDASVMLVLYLNPLLALQLVELPTTACLWSVKPAIVVRHFAEFGKATFLKLDGCHGWYAGTYNRSWPVGLRERFAEESRTWKREAEGFNSFEVRSFALTFISLVVFLREGSHYSHDCKGCQKKNINVQSYRQFSIEESSHSLCVWTCMSSLRQCGPWCSFGLDLLCGDSMYVWTVTVCKKTCLSSLCLHSIIPRLFLSQQGPLSGRVTQRLHLNAGDSQLRGSPDCMWRAAWGCSVLSA